MASTLLKPSRKKCSATPTCTAEGFEEYNKTTLEKLLCKLKMALEGGFQSRHLWQQANTDFLKSYGFTQFWSKLCIFIRKRDGSLLLII
eukprot:6176086-Pleurochrysis_carterae.AAC.1